MEHLKVMFVIINSKSAKKKWDVSVTFLCSLMRLTLFCEKYSILYRNIKKFNRIDKRIITLNMITFSLDCYS